MFEFFVHLCFEPDNECALCGSDGDRHVAPEGENVGGQAPTVRPPVQRSLTKFKCTHLSVSLLRKLFVCSIHVYFALT